MGLWREYLYRLGASTISATSWSTPARTFTESGITYDKNGNITKLTRAGYHATSGSTSLLTDNLTYTNTGNRLTTLSHNNATGSVKASGSYSMASNIMLSCQNILNSY